LFWIIPILKGIGQGFLISILSFGPSFFTLINSGIKGGKAEGMRVALGIFLSEFIMALICFFGLSRFFILPEFQLGFSFFAAAAISYIGIRGFYKKYQQFLRSIEQPAAKSKSFFKGFILNLINPFVLLLWVGLLAIVSVYYDKTDPNYEISILINLISILFTLFLLDLGKVYLSDFLGRKLSRRVYYYINKYFGLILLIIGIYFFYHFFTLLVPYLKHGH
jgi:threonine/homoserine/homoserine lactone efflux protein